MPALTAGVNEGRAVRLWSPKLSSTDPRFAGHPAVTVQPNLRFYAGAPLIAATSHIIGTLCIFDTTARTATQADLTALRSFADMTMHHLQHQLDNRQALTDSRATPRPA